MNSENEKGGAFREKGLSAMRICIVNNSVIPVSQYGGVQRVIWYLGKELARMGHRVTFLVREGSSCPFARVVHIDPAKPMGAQIPADTDVISFNNTLPREKPAIPYVVTLHGNVKKEGTELDRNTVFVSKDHAQRYGAEAFVHNGLDWDDYGVPELNAPRSYAHFLGKAAWRVKNLKGAVKVVTALPGERLYVLGGRRLNFKMGFRFTPSLRVKFFGMVGGGEKLALLQGSKALVFPVRWHEPFGLALTESLYFGCPVLGTPYGSLPEIVGPEVGFLSAKSDELSAALSDVGRFSRKLCHEYARDTFNSAIMARGYLRKYEAVINGEALNIAQPVAGKQPENKFLPWD